MCYSTRRNADNLVTSLTIASISSAVERSEPLSLEVLAEIDQPVDAAQRLGDPAIYLVSRSDTFHRYVNVALAPDLDPKSASSPMVTPSVTSWPSVFTWRC